MRDSCQTGDRSWRDSSWRSAWELLVSSDTNRRLKTLTWSDLLGADGKREAHGATRQQRQEVPTPPKAPALWGVCALRPGERDFEGRSNHTPSVRSPHRWYLQTRRCLCCCCLFDLSYANLFSVSVTNEFCTCFKHSFWCGESRQHLKAQLRQLSSCLHVCPSIKFLPFSFNLILSPSCMKLKEP